MNFISRILQFHETLINQKKNSVKDSECVRILELMDKIHILFSKDSYIAKSDYLNMIPEYKETVEYFKVLLDSRMLKRFCAQNSVNEKEVTDLLSTLDNFEEKINELNDKYIERHLKTDKEYFDNILKEADPQVMLDENQRKVILTDEDYCLVVAGAGAGKTTTVAAKVKYLVEKMNIEPRDILVISFTNKAVGELRNKINKDLNIDCPIATFHSTGNAILRINDPEPLNIFDNTKMYYLLQDYFKKAILTNESLVNNLILFFGSYFDAPYEGKDLNKFFNKAATANYTTMRSELDEFKREIIDAKTKKKVTIRNEVLKSYQEVQIANFLYLNNIDYEYEPIYPYRINFSKKPYTPDFIIQQGEKIAYIEHFGVTEDGENNRYSEEELRRYKKCVNDKVKLHRTHGTKLIYTFSEFKDGRNLLVHLKEKLENAGFILEPKSNKEIMEKLISSEESRYIRKLINLLCRFITNFKTNGYEADEFDRMYHSTKNVRSKLFLNICQDCYLEYQRYLKEHNAVDFEDMINESAKVIRQVKDMKQKLHFKYIIVDEYQDISRQRFDLTKALSEVCDGKIIAVGDDWQSIYAFSGSDISLFTKFRESMGYAKLLKIEKTYRNAQEVIDIAGNFVQKNPTQISKTLISNKTIQDPVIIYTYDGTYKKMGENRKTGNLYATAHAVETALEQIMEYNRMDGKNDDGKILLLGRYGFDGDQLERSGLFEYKIRGNKLKSVKYPKLDITFMTVHMSKGLGYDNVIVVNGRNETYGFPSKIEDDPVLSFVIKGDRSIDYAEERRLFYVAMTRTKNRVYFIAPEQNPSEFLLEIKHDYKNVVLKGKWNEKTGTVQTKKPICPICGYPMQYRYKNSYGLKLFMCTNEQEICGFMTNDLSAGKLSIMKCSQCKDGYLIVKYARGEYFLGCTNYKKDGTGCNNTVSRMEYYLLNGMKENGKEQLPSETGEEPGEISESVKTKAPVRRHDKNMPKLKETEIDSGIKKNDFRETELKNYRKFSDFSEQECHEILKNTVLCLEHISENSFFNISVLIGVLQGKKEKRMEKFGLTEVPEYGMYADISRDDLRAVIQWLLDNHYMLKTRGKYSVLHSTYEGNHFEEQITVRKVKKFRDFMLDPDREIFIEEI